MLRNLFKFILISGFIFSTASASHQNSLDYETESQHSSKKQCLTAEISTIERDIVYNIIVNADVQSLNSLARVNKLFYSAFKDALAERFKRIGLPQEIRLSYYLDPQYGYKLRDRVIFFTYGNNINAPNLAYYEILKPEKGKRLEFSKFINENNSSADKRELVKTLEIDPLNPPENFCVYDILLEKIAVYFEKGCLKDLKNAPYNESAKGTLETFPFAYAILKKKVSVEAIQVHQTEKGIEFLFKY